MGFNFSFCRSLVFLLTALTICFGAVAAQAVDERAAKDEYLREMQRLKRDRPSEYEAFTAMVISEAKRFLGQLGFEVGVGLTTWDKTSEASLRIYQMQRKVPVTGSPHSPETLDQIQADRAVLNKQIVTLPGRHVFLEFWDQDYVTANGTWIIRGESLAIPEQTTKIHCDRKARTCTEATAMVHRMSSPHLSVIVETYEIERWDSHEIVTKPREYGCVRYVKRFNRAQVSVTGIRSKIVTRDNDCKALDSDEKHLLLSDGVELYSGLRKRQLEDEDKILAPAVTRVFARVKAEMAKGR